MQPVTDLVTDEECYEALQYLDKIAHAYAEAFAEVDYQSYMLRQQEAVGALMSDETANDRRLWDARTQPGYLKRVKSLHKAQIAWKEIEAKRHAAILKAEIWRTVHADKRARDIPEPGRR